VALAIEHSMDGQSWSESGRVNLQNGQHTLALASLGVQLGPTVRYRLLFSSNDGHAAPLVRSVSFH
jgi:hypothetical protein